MRDEFKVHLLSEDGIKRAKDLAEAFSELLDKLEGICPGSPEFTISKRKLEEACFYAKKAMAQKYTQ